MWGVGEGQSLAGPNPSPVPTPSQYPTPSIAIASSLCNGRNTVLAQWNFVSPYLLCYNYSLHSEGVQLFLESSSGFTRIKGAGGVFDANYLVRQGVPSSTAAALVSGLHP
jgi:hypothetical protein